MKKLGFGCMRFPLLDAEDNTSIDFPQVCQMVDLFLERGFTYFDTAYFYHGGTSEETVNRALVQRHPRDSFTLATKLPLAKLKEATAQEQADMFQLQLSRCGVEFFDYYLLHCIDDENYEIAQRLDSFAFVQQKKAEGYIRQAGFSFHGTPELLEEVLTQHPEVDFVQLQINYLDWENPKVQSRRCYEVAVAHHKPVVVMEPVKGGKLANPSPAVREMFAALDPNASPSSFGIWGISAPSLPRRWQCWSRLPSRFRPTVPFPALPVATAPTAAPSTSPSPPSSPCITGPWASRAPCRRRSTGRRALRAPPPRPASPAASARGPAPSIWRWWSSCSGWPKFLNDSLLCAEIGAVYQCGGTALLK